LVVSTSASGYVSTNLGCGGCSIEVASASQGGSHMLALGRMGVKLEVLRTKNVLVE